MRVFLFPEKFRKGPPQVAGVDFQKFEDFELARRRRRFFKIQNFETWSWPAAGVDFPKLDLGDFELARRRRQFF